MHISANLRLQISRKLGKDAGSLPSAGQEMHTRDFAADRQIASRNLPNRLQMVDDVLDLHHRR
jgi:hypothetical protein